MCGVSWYTSCIVIGVDMLNPFKKWRWTDCTFSDPHLVTVANITFSADGEPFACIVTTAGFFPDDLELQSAQDYANRWTNPVASFYRDCLETTDSERYFAGPIVDGVFTEYATIDDAQAHPFTMPQSINILLPSPINIRSTRLFHRSQGVSYALFEFLPHRMIEVDYAA